ncbi:MAG: hypothetical protein Q9214_002959 [Letrouitia sp. 1 TL-2023]
MAAINLTRMKSDSRVTVTGVPPFDEEVIRSVTNTVGATGAGFVDRSKVFEGSDESSVIVIAAALKEQ